MLRMLRSAVFIVPMKSRLLGNRKPREYCKSMGSSRYSKRYISSPKTRGRLARFISSMTRTYGRSSVSMASTIDFTTPGRTSKAALRPRTRDEGPQRTPRSRSSDGTGRCAGDWVVFCQVARDRSCHPRLAGPGGPASTIWRPVPPSASTISARSVSVHNVSRRRASHASISSFPRIRWPGRQVLILVNDIKHLEHRSGDQPAASRLRESPRCCSGRPRRSLAQKRGQHAQDH